MENECPNFQVQLQRGFEHRINRAAPSDDSDAPPMLADARDRILNVRSFFAVGMAASALFTVGACFAFQKSGDGALISQLFLNHRQLRFDTL